MFDSQFNPAQRIAALKSLASDEFDVLIIGGGVTGVGAALDAASRGLKVALVENQDIAAGTSSRSSKLIHGGLRYLEQYDFKLVREALHERELMVSSLAPHLIKPVGFLYPLHEKYRERTYVGAGLALYDVLRGFQRALPWHKHLSEKKIATIAPSLRGDLINGAIKYFDAQVDDARHTLAVARTAARHGAIIATRVQCEELVRDGKRVVGAKVRDLNSGKKITVSAKVTVMCAGVTAHARRSILPPWPLLAVWCFSAIGTAMLWPWTETMANYCGVPAWPLLRRAFPSVLPWMAASLLPCPPAPDSALGRLRCPRTWHRN